MESLVMEFKISQYEELTKLNENDKSKIYLVKNKKDNKIYIKKVLTNYNIKIYEILRGMDLKNIPKIYDIFVNDDNLIIIEEYINGNTLKDILDTSGLLKEDVVIDYIISLCDTLNELHKLNPPIIHRDIKPSNIIVSNDNVVKLIDFDVSREFKENRSEDTVIQGTEEYAPPEQFGFIQTDGRSDIYSTGILMNVLTTKEYPKNKMNDGYLKNIIKKCTQFSPKDRYQSILDLKEDLRVLKCKVNTNMPLDEIKRKEDKIINVVKRNNINKLKEITKDLIIKKDLKEEDKVKEQITIKSFYKVVPGFRTNKVWKIILASLVYLFLLFGLFSGTGSEGVKMPFIENLAIVVLSLLLIFLYSNFLEVKEKFPLLKSNNRLKNLLGYFLYTIIIIIMSGLLLELSKI
ncbi:MAG: serine/threonine-protein kinase [Clostridium sp.]|uniref:serine/threonine-protein kinase n=4 Tax=Clostridium sp. TaxID=1506 RepID=UPI002FC743E8